MKSVLIVVLLAIGCTDANDRQLLEANLGPCNDLDDATCRADDRCQLAYEDSGHQPQAFPVRCLQLGPGPSSTAACETVAFDACRARSDCSPLYWQDLGPDDGPVGDPYYKSCTAEPR